MHIRKSHGNSKGAPQCVSSNAPGFHVFTDGFVCRVDLPLSLVSSSKPSEEIAIRIFTDGVYVWEICPFPWSIRLVVEEGNRVIELVKVFF